MNITDIAKDFFSFRSSKGTEPGTNRLGQDALGASLFGSIAGGALTIPTDKSFIPVDGQSNILRLTGEPNGPQWLGLRTKEQQRAAYDYCSPLATVIDKIAQADTNGIISFVDEETREHKTNWKKNPKLGRIMKLLKNPNKMQTYDEFNSQQVAICKIHGYCPVLPIYPAGFDKSYSTSMFNLDPRFCHPIINTDFDPYSQEAGKRNPIKEWVGTIFGKKFRIDAEDILIIEDGFVDSMHDNFGLPMSKVQGLDFAISNICAAMEADNVLLKKKGPLGVFSYDPKPDMAGWQPLKDDEKKDLQNDLKRYGLGLQQLQYIISKMPMKWNPMSFNVAELMTKETFRQGVDTICDRMSYPAELMSGKNATYENRTSAERYLYQNNIIPFSLRRTAKLNNFFELEGTVLEISYAHISALKEDIVKEAQSQKFLSEALDIMWKGGLVTWNEVRLKKKLQEVTGMDIYYPEYVEKFGIKEEPKPSNEKDPKPKDTPAA